MKFIDLFAGLGGFHQALSQLGHKCVFASETDAELAKLYYLNFGMKPEGDIRKSYAKVPAHDILCAGFPCQPFSKAGEQLGFDCPQWGDLFEYVIKILRRHKPRYLIIENVPNLMKHDKGRTWEKVCNRLRYAGYAISSAQLSPHFFGVPQIRARAVIVGDRRGLDAFAWPQPTHNADAVTIKSVLDVRPDDARRLTPASIKYIKSWQSLLDRLPKDEQLPSFPIWAMEFGATYPFKTESPNALAPEKLVRYKGAFGKRITGSSKKEMRNCLPAYARTRSKSFPDWKIQFIDQNRKFYQRHKKIIDEWLPSIQSFAPSFQKLEWNWKEGQRNLWDTIVQFRASGIRAKRPNAAPSLVALTTSQIPVISWERRYMTMRECARLQSMDALKQLPSTQQAAYRALGNAVNVKVIVAVAACLIQAPVNYKRSKKAPQLGKLKAHGRIRETGAFLEAAE